MRKFKKWVFKDKNVVFCDNKTQIQELFRYSKKMGYSKHCSYEEINKTPFSHCIYVTKNGFGFGDRKDYEDNNFNIRNFDDCIKQPKELNSKDIKILIDYIQENFEDYDIDINELKKILENSKTLVQAKLYCHENYYE